MFVPSFARVLPVLGGFRVPKRATVEFAEVQDAFGYGRGGLEIAAARRHGGTLAEATRSSLHPL